MLRRVTNRAREGYQKHSDFILLAILFTSFRFLSLLLFEPGGYILDWGVYYHPGANFAQLSDRGLYPVIDYWMEYPPLFPWLAVIVYRLSMFIPAWRDPNLWFNLLLGSTFLICELGNLVLVYAIALRLGDRQRAIKCAWLYAGLFFPLMTLMFWFDNLPLFFLLLGVYAIIASRPVWGGIAAGVGFMIKMFPAFVGPVALRVFPRLRQKVTYVLVAGLLVLLIALPLLLTNPTFALTPFLRQRSVGPWETVWALLDGYYSGGEATPLETRFDPTAVEVSSHETHFPYAAVALAFIVLYLILYTRPIDWQDRLKAVAFCGLSIDLLLIFYKGYSPQWIINVLPFIVLLMPSLTGVTYCVLLMVANVVEFPIALVLLDGQPWLFAAAVVFRTLILVILGVDFGLILFPSARASRLQHLVLISIVLLALVGSVPLGALALRDYASQRYAENPYAETMDFLRKHTGAGVIFTDQRLYQQTYPFLVTETRPYLLEHDQRLENRMTEVTARHDTVWVVCVDSEDDQRSNPAVEGWLKRHAFPVAVKWFSNARLARYSIPTRPLSKRSLEANFADLIELNEYALDENPVRPGQVVHVKLSWRSLAPLDTDYTVFVHLMDGNSRLWAQHDRQPAGGSRPTSSWQPGEQVSDNHGLALPADIPPGQYEIELGLYHAATGQRLLILREPEDSAEDRILVGPVIVAAEDR